MTTEDESKLRNKDNNAVDVEKANMSTTGIKEPCEFNQIKGYHITENVTVDMMHDVLEGVCIYVLRAILYMIIFTINYFTLGQLNSRIRNFDFGSQNSNKPPIIRLKEGKNKLNLKVSAADMLCLVRYLGLIIGDLIPESDIHWNLFKHLRQILDILMSPQMICTDAKVLKELVKDLNHLYKELYGKLKPKFHHLTHYPRILINNGPIHCRFVSD